MHLQRMISWRSTVRSGAEERTFWGARLDVLTFRLRSYHVLISYSAEWSGPKFHKTLMFLGQAGTFLSFQARRSLAMRSSTSDLTVSAVSVSRKGNTHKMASPPREALHIYNPFIFFLNLMIKTDVSMFKLKLIWEMLYMFHHCGQSHQKRVT